jgi:LysR family transcriptional regulator, low CO2-responsive transcriptional regulator
MNVTFRQLRLFLALAESGSVSAAARALHVTQPTASMQLRELSHSVGLPLHELIARRVHLTEAGQELARTARLMMDEWEAYGQKVDALRGLTRGRLKVAVVSTAKYFVPRLLGAYCDEHPEIDIELEVLNRDGVVQRLRDNRDDLYVMSMPPADIDIEDRVFMANPLVAVAPADHALAQRKRLALRELRDENFILREPGSGTRMAADAHFKRARFKPRVRLQLGSNEAVKEAVAGRLGLAVLSLHALGADPVRAGVAVLDVEGFPIRSMWHVVRHKGKRLSPVAESFLQHLMAQARGAPAAPARRRG